MPGWSLMGKNGCRLWHQENLIYSHSRGHIQSKKYKLKKNYKIINSNCGDHRSIRSPSISITLFSLSPKFGLVRSLSKSYSASKLLQIRKCLNKIENYFGKIGKIFMDSFMPKIDPSSHHNDINHNCLKYFPAGKTEMSALGKCSGVTVIVIPATSSRQSWRDGQITQTQTETLYGFNT